VRLVDDDEDEQGRAAQELSDTGTELAGALVGGAVGTLGGPVGVAAGAVAGVAVQRVARVVAARLSGREAQRAGAALVLISADARRRADRGDVPRNDGFFDGHGGLRSDAEELLEGVLRQAASSYEERKVPLLARLYSETAHGGRARSDDALFALRVAADLTYRQFVLLGVLAHHGRFAGAFARADALRQEGAFEPSPALLHALDDLGDQRLFGILQGNRVADLTEGFLGPGRPSSYAWASLRLTATGETMVRLTGAGEIEEGELSATVAALCGSSEDRSS
jgi:hypothetical protein